MAKYHKNSTYISYAILTNLGNSSIKQATTEANIICCADLLIANSHWPIFVADTKSDTD